MNPGLVIVGAGIAASELAFALRRNGFAAPVTLIGEEAHPPYQRPPLSKAYLRGELRRDALYARPPAAYDKAAVTVASRVRADAIDRAARQVILSDGRRVPYATLVLAVGGRPRPLPGLDGSGIRNLHAVRTIDEAEHLRAQLVRGARLVIIGAGYLGLEFASVAVKLGLRVCVVEYMPRALARVTSEPVSAFFEQVHRQNGVELRTGVSVAGFDVDPRQQSIRSVQCAGGAEIPADVVIASVGMVPNVELAAAAGLAVGDGIEVDADGRTSDPDIFAIGDCCNAPSRLDGRRMRLESQPNAIEQARVAAATICGQAPPRAGVPWFWSDQYDLKLQIAGISRGHDRAVLRGSMDARRFSLLYLKDHRVIAADTVNSPADFNGARLLIAQGHEVDEAHVADPSLPLAVAA